MWARSGGRCAICNKLLLEGSITRRALCLGELAHIVGQQKTAGSPRGQVRMSAEDRDKAENLMLLCAGDHDEIDRAGTLDVLTIEKLRAIKRTHEDWIRRVTGIDRSRQTIVLRMIGRVRGTDVELTKTTASTAVIRCDNVYPNFPLSYQQDGVEIDLRELPGEATPDSAYWSVARAKIDEVIETQLKPGVRREHIAHVSVFGFARLPLLVYLGSRLDDTFQVAIYQRHRTGETWVWPRIERLVRFDADPRPLRGQEAVLVLNVSGTIQPDELPAAVANLPRVVLRPVGATPEPDIISGKATLNAFVSAMRTVFSSIEATSKQVQRLHVFGALPVSAAVALGRAHDAHVHPRLVVYDRTATGQYLPAVEIQDHSASAASQASTA